MDKIPDTIRELFTRDDINGAFKEAEKNLQYMDEIIIIWRDKRNADKDYFYSGRGLSLVEFLGALEFVKLKEMQLSSDKDSLNTEEDNLEDS
jgi:hypothetical protein